LRQHQRQLQLIDNSSGSDSGVTAAKAAAAASSSQCPVPKADNNHNNQQQQQIQCNNKLISPDERVSLFVARELSMAQRKMKNAETMMTQHQHQQ
jgi:hypothetical protein